MTPLRRKLQVELSDEAQSALQEATSAINAVGELLTETLAAVKQVNERVKGEIMLAVAEAADLDGVEAFAIVDDASKPAEGKPSLIDTTKFQRSSSIPEVMQETEVTEISVSEQERVRATPFTRAPRHTQVEWLREVMADGGWYAPISLAREYATDERHFRYLRGALSGRLREMWEEDQVERRDSQVKGSMFEYRLKGGERP